MTCRFGCSTDPCAHGGTIHQSAADWEALAAKVCRSCPETVAGRAAVIIVRRPIESGDEF